VEKREAESNPKGVPCDPTKRMAVDKVSERPLASQRRFTTKSAQFGEKLRRRKEGSAGRTHKPPTAFLPSVGANLRWQPLSHRSEIEILRRPGLIVFL
jgi:hypothetical protein